MGQEMARQDLRKCLLGMGFMAALLLALPGCGTVEGAGEDIEAAGDAISDTARETKQEMSK